MWRKTLQRHSSDEALLAHADGELSPLVERIMMRHLKKCWQCRARLAELENQAQDLARALRQEPFPGPERVAQARAKLLSDQEELERQHAYVPIFLSRRVASPFRNPALVGVCFTMLLLGVTVYFTESGGMPKPKEILAQAQKREQAVLDTPLAVHQTMRVEIAELAPRTAIRSGRLDIWAEAPREHFALRWSDGQGTVRHAIWRGPGAREQIYSSASIGEVSEALQPAPRVRSMADLSVYGLDAPMLEAAFLKWLKHWRGRPISLGSDFSVFAGRDGVALAMERLSVTGGAPALRLSAVRTEPGMRIEVTMEIDARTWKPRLQRVRFETPEKIVEFRLVMETLQFASRPPSAVFRSGEWLRQTTPQPRRDARRLPKAADLAVQTALPPAADLEGVELEVRYALHRVRTCLGEPVEVIRDHSGNILVQGLVKNAERKSELLAALSGLGQASLVSVDVRAISELPDDAAETLALSSALTEVTAGSLPIEDYLESYFRERGAADGDSVARRITDFTNGAVSGGEAALGEAWAFRRLVERYPAHKYREMDPHQRRLLEIMLRDHMAALWTRVADIRRLVEPVVLPLAGVRNGERWPEAGTAGVAEVSSSNSDLRTFGRVRRIDELLRALFAGGEVFVATRDRDLKESALDLLRAFRGLEDDFRDFESKGEQVFLRAPDSGAR